MLIYVELSILLSHRAFTSCKFARKHCIRICYNIMNSIGHLLISVAKSGIRIAACVVSLMHGSVWVLAAGFLAAEILGIAEELVDERK